MASGDDKAPERAADTESTPASEPPKRGRGRPRKEPATPKASAAGGYVVAPGKAITTIRGIKAEGQPITADDLGGGKDALDHLAAGGYVVSA